MWIVTAAESREMDRRATEEFGIPARVLMERAGLAVFSAVRELLPCGRLTVVCGKGNNGGDGFVVARLALEAGYAVDCLVAAESEFELSPSAFEQWQVARAQGVQAIFATDARYEAKFATLGCRDLLIDALLGTGASGTVEGFIAEAIHRMNRSGVPIVSIDLPSGISCDTGEEMGEAVWALRTVTMGSPKPFLFQGAGVDQCGYWSVADIGIPHALLDQPRSARLIDHEWVADRLPERMKASHKGSNGQLLVVAGSRDMPGAAALVARAASRSGAGLVIVACIESVRQAVGVHAPEAVFVTLPEVNGVPAPEAAELVLAAQSRVDAAVFGPGLTQRKEVHDFLGRVWQQWTKPAVIDADALNAVSAGVALPASELVLTPHTGEMSRMMQRSIAEIMSNRFETARDAVSRFGKVTLLKGAYTIVGIPDEPLIVNSTGNPGLASAGMGDVLSGTLGTLLAQHLDPAEAAACAVYWHGAAADLCADQIGLSGYSPLDVCDRLPESRRAMTCRERNA